MTHPSQGISPLRQRMIDDMRMRKLAPQTQAGYLRVVQQFAAFLGRPPDTATVEDLRCYQLHLVDHGISSRGRKSVSEEQKCFPGGNEGGGTRNACLMQWREARHAPDGVERSDI